MKNKYRLSNSFRIIVVSGVIICCHLAYGKPNINEAYAAKSQFSYTGLHYPPLPQECVNVSSGMLHEQEDMAFSEVSCANTHMFWLEQFTHRDENGKSHWEVVDEILLPSLSGGQSIARFICAIDAVDDPLLFAVGKSKRKGRKEYFRNITLAFKINYRTKRFDVINAKRVTCSIDEDRD